MNERRKVVIDRSKWRCGEDDPELSHGTGKVMLLNEEGFMCCLGFAAEQLGGCSKEELLNVTAPDGLRKVVPPLNMFIKIPGDAPIMEDTDFSNSAIETNDGPRSSMPIISMVDREEHLRALFVKHDIDLEFVGEYMHPPRV